MSRDNIFKNIYNKTNNLDQSLNLDIEDSVFVNYIDILRNKTLPLKVLTNKECICLNSSNFNFYYEKCDKCNQTGYLTISGNKVICNKCRGSKKLIKNYCSICKNSGYYLDKVEKEISLNQDIKNNDIIKIKGLGKIKDSLIGNLNLTIKIIDYQDYLFKDNDLYYKKTIIFSEDEVKKSITKTIETPKGIRKISVNNKDEYEIIKFEKASINDGDFFVGVKKQLPPLKGEDIYANVILKENSTGFYLEKSDLLNEAKPLKTVHYFKPINSNEFLYLELDENINYFTHKFEKLGKNGLNGGENGTLYLKTFYGNNFLVAENKLYDLNITFNNFELENGRKNITINKDKIYFSFEKNLDNFSFIKIGNYGLIKNKEQTLELFALINPKNKKEYRISVNINKNDKHFFITDYKHYFNKNVRKYYSNTNLENYLEININKNRKNKILELYDNENNKIFLTLLLKENEDV